MQVRSILNKTVSKRFRSLEYSINPYRGCEFGCRYCYARYAHGFLAPKETSAPRDGAVGTVPGAAAGPGEGVPGPAAADFNPFAADPAHPNVNSGAKPDFSDPLTFERLIFL